ncbi:MAG: hypothetical protein HYS13_02770 [Planctomycetia bacterium]|nr:hypothetical protein [Planctomycetia bacterium]
MPAIEGTGRFVIEMNADALLSELSNDFADLLLAIASQVSKKRTDKNVPVIGVCELAEASQILCKLVEEGMKTGRIPSDGAEILEKFRSFCERATSECANEPPAQPQPPPAHG